MKENLEKEANRVIFVASLSLSLSILFLLVKAI
jgi:hypothetical protein